jgi:hypothetical protein
MAWITPKTNWQSTDYINTEDYNRIQGNLQHIANECSLIIQAYATQDIDDLPYAEKWNIAENNLDEINQLTYEFELGAKKQFMPNGNYIDYVELNRLEKAIAKIHYVHLNQLELSKHLPFTLGEPKVFDCPRRTMVNANSNVMGNRLDFELGGERGEYSDE